MPFAQIYMIEGRTEDMKRAVIEKVSAALVEATNAPKEAVRVWITEVPNTNWGIAG
ncbi:MAG: 4-oxalocrotonate tautomerase, partial [Comamonadaceae bacterium]|nr:4-oxalocrotonate tautomerase [Comamonadaceae bacterium]